MQGSSGIATTMAVAIATASYVATSHIVAVGGETKRIQVLAVAAICYYIVYRLIHKLREWRHRYLLIKALPSPKATNLWLCHLSDILASPNVKGGKIITNHNDQEIKNVWGTIENWCKEMCYQKGHGGFHMSAVSPSRLPFASASTFWAIDYELVKKVVNHPDLQAKGRAYNNSKPLIGHSVLIATGHDWKRMRKLTAKAFSNKVMVNTHDASIRILHNKVFPYFDRKHRLRDNPYVDLVELLGRFTLDILGIVSFSYEFGGVDELASSVATTHQEHQEQQQLSGNENNKKKSVHQIFSEITQDIVILCRYRELYKPKRMDKNVRDLNNVINSVIDTKIKQQQSNMSNNKTNSTSDLLDYLMERSPQDGKPILSREEIVGNTKVFSFAGHDTTTTTMSAMFYELGRSPHVVEKLREEIDHYFDSGGCGPTYNDLRGSCRYVNKVLRETLRLHPPALFSRTSGAKEVVLKTSKFRYVLPKNTQIFMSPWLSQRYYRNSNNDDGVNDSAKEEVGRGQRREQPYDVFDPDRTVDYENDPFFPFAIGARNCVGREMAMAEIRAVLAHVVYSYDLVLAPEDEVKGMETYSILTLRVGNYGMKFVKRKREDAT